MFLIPYFLQGKKKLISDVSIGFCLQLETQTGQSYVATHTVMLQR